MATPEDVMEARKQLAATEVEEQAVADAVALVKAEAPAAVAAAEAAIPLPHKAWKRHLVSITERSVSTFLFAFLGLVTATNLTDPTALKAAAIAGGISVLAYLKTVAAAYTGSTSVGG